MIKPSELWVPEFYDIDLVLQFGATKYEPNNWLEPDGTKASLEQQCDSMFHHLCEIRCGRVVDRESKLHPALHLACRAMMSYTRYKRGLEKVVGDSNENS